MKTKKHLYFILIIFSIFTIGCSRNTEIDSENTIIKLTVVESSDKGIMTTDENNQSPKYYISNYNSNFKIVDIDENPLTWDDLKDAKNIEVHFSGIILETYPASLEKISKIVILP